MPPLLTAAQVAALLTAGWLHAPTCLSRHYRFKSFTDTWGFLSQVAMESHRRQHHPTISTTYTHVSIELTTHDASGITELDTALAARIERFALRYPQRDHESAV